MVEEEEDDEVCKVVLLGESGVGKTCIISRFINNTFQEGLMSSNGASYASKSATFPEYGNKTIKLEIWDTAGQEKYRSLNQIFYKDASICILVYDITNIKSFNALREYWIKEIKEACPKQIILGLAANKCDLDDKEQVEEKTARDFANEINAIFMYTSAARSVGIDELFHNVGCKYIDPNYKFDQSSITDTNNDMKNNSENNSNKKTKNEKNKKIKLDEKVHKKGEKKKKCC